MDQRWIGGAMLTAGIALFGVVAWIQSDRFAFTSARQGAASESLRTVVASSTAATVEIAEPEPPAGLTPAEPVIDLPVQIIRARKPGPATRAAAPSAAPPHEPIPCSPWEEIGPMYVDDGVASGVRRVRKLC